jgi:hypothetical protein
VSSELEKYGCQHCPVADIFLKSSLSVKYQLRTCVSLNGISRLLS